MARESLRFLWACGTVALALSLGIPSTAGAKPPRPPAAPKPVPLAAKKKNGKERPPNRDKPAKDQPGEVDEDAPPAPAPAAQPEEGRALQRGERVEFDGRLIQGQTAKAGAVYLFARVSTNLRSMVKERSSFRDKTVRTVFLEDPPIREEDLPPPVAGDKDKEPKAKSEPKTKEGAP